MDIRNAQNLSISALSKDDLLKVYKSEYATLKDIKSQVSAKEERYRNLIARKENLKNVRSGAESTAEIFAGNVGDINKMVWPFWFPTNLVVVEPTRIMSASFTVTLEAPFSMISFTKAIYLRGGSSPNWTYTYIDPNNIAAPVASGLTLNLKDTSSGQSFLDRAMSIDHIGHAQRPTRLPSPIMLIPNQTLEIELTNNHSANVYAVSLVFFGYRIRVQDSEKIMSLVQI